MKSMSDWDSLALIAIHLMVLNVLLNFILYVSFQMVMHQES